METEQAPDLGLLWFYGKDKQHGIHFAPGNDESVPLDWGHLAENVEEGHFYLSNLSLPALQEVMDDQPASVMSGVLHDKGLIVGVQTLADELGIRTSKDEPDTGELAILASIRRAFEAACYRLGLNLEETGIQQRRIRRQIFERSASSAMKATSIEGADLSFSPAPHRWISVPRDWVEGVHIKRVTLSRHSLFSLLLRQPVPVGEWLMGSDSATPDMILNAVGEQRDILLEADVTLPEPSGDGAFMSVVTTQEPRALYTGQEVRRMVDEGITFTVKRWWHGETAPARALPETHPLSLADGLMLEMMHRSWRENPEIGFWLSIAERITLHHLAERLHQQGVELCGYGSGKLTFLAPDDRDAAQGVDKRLLRDNHRFGVQLPLSDLRSHPELPTLVDYLTDQQVIALADPALLGAIDRRITQGDQEGMERLLEQADDALKALLPEAEGNAEPPTAEATDNEDT